MNMFCIRKNIFSDRKKNLLFLPCNMAAVQNLYTVNEFLWLQHLSTVHYLQTLSSWLAGTCKGDDTCKFSIPLQSLFHIS